MNGRQAMEKEQALKLWEKLFGDREIAYDYSSHPMKKEDFNNPNSQYSWNLDFIKPSMAGGLNNESNLLPTALATMNIREGKNSFRIGKFLYEVRKGHQYGTYAIFDVTDRNHPVNMEPDDENQEKAFNDLRIGTNNGQDADSVDNTFNPYPNSNNTEQVLTEEIVDELANRIASEKVEEPEQVASDVSAENENGESEEVKEENVPETQKEEEASPTTDEISEPKTVEQEDVKPETENHPIEQEATKESTKESTVEELLAENNRLQEQIASDKEEIEGLNNRLSELDEKVSEKELDGEIPVDYERSEVVEEYEDDSTEKEIASLKDEASKKDQEISDLKNTIATLNQDTAAIKNQNQGLLDEKESLTSASADLEKELTALKEENSSLKQHSQALETEKSSLTERINQIQAKETSDASLNEISKKEKEELNERINSEKEMIATLSNENSYLKSQVTELNKTIEANTATEKELTDSQSLNEESTKEIQALKDENNQLSNEIAAEKKNSESLKDELNSLKAEKETINQSLLTDLEKDKQLNEEKTGLEKEKAELLEKIDSLTKENTYLQNNNGSSLSKVEELTKEKESLNEKMSSLDSEKEVLSSENASLKRQVEELTANASSLKETNLQAISQETQQQTEIDQLKKANEVLTSKNEELNATISSLNDEKTNLEKNNQELVIEKENSNKIIADLNSKITEISSTNQADSDKEKELQSKIADLETTKDELFLKASNYVAELEKQKTAFSSLEKNHQELTDNFKKTTDELTAEKNTLSLQIDELKKSEEEKSNKVTELDNLLQAKNGENEEIINGLKANVSQLNKFNLYLSLGGSKDSYDDFKAAINDLAIDYNEENVKGLLLKHSEWMRQDDLEIYNSPIAKESFSEEIKEPVINATEISEEDISMVDEERKEAKLALKAFKEKYPNTDKVSDFAGREIKYSDYKDEESLYGWDYRLFDGNKEADSDNVLIANIKSLKDFVPKGSFTSNGHTYHVENKDGQYQLLSDDYVSDPYNLDDAMKVSKLASTKKEPLIYIFIKALGIQASTPDNDSLFSFFDIIERTVKRCCPDSFVNMQVNAGNGADFVFLTFDGTVDSAYEETLNYAILLNSYRKEFYKANKLNAIIVIDKLDAAMSERHLSYEKLTYQTKDQGLMAIRYDLNQNTVINSTIKRTIHIGPSIYDDLDVDKTHLSESRLGQGNFAELFKFSKKYYECHYVYRLTGKIEEDK